MTADEQPEPELMLARAYLSRVCEPGCVPLWAFVDRVGPLEAVAAISSGRAPRGVRDVTEARCASTDPHADLEAAERAGIRLLSPESASWPHFAFAALERLGRARVAAFEAGERSRRDSGERVPPVALWVKGPGEISTAATRSVAVVGSRASTAYGEHVTAELGYAVARSGVAVVSGGAHGIDAGAHRSALAAGGDTVLVSAGGLDRPYPPGNAPLFDAVAATGLLVSESPPGAAPHRHRFLSRNRLIAAFGTATLVVEATLRSGAANTAAHAAAMGRPVLAVPGPITSPMSAGCHALLRQRETVLVASAADVLAVVGAMGEGIAADGEPGRAGDVRDELDALDPVARRVFDALAVRRRVTPDDIASRSGVPIIEVIRALPVLDLAGLVDAAPDGYRVAGRVRSARSARSTRLERPASTVPA